MKKLTNFFFLIYKNIFSRSLVFLFGKGCRFYPTCSDYSRNALDKFGLRRGTVLTFKRLVRCHPFSNSNYFDPLPSKK